MLLVYLTIAMRGWAAVGSTAAVIATVVSQAGSELFERNVAAAIGIEALEQLGQSCCAGAFEAWDCGEFPGTDQCVFSSDLIEFLRSAHFDPCPDGFFPRRLLFSRKIAAAGNVKLGNALGAGCGAGCLDGLTLFLVDDAVVVRIILREKIRQHSVAERFVVVSSCDVAAHRKYRQ